MIERTIALVALVALVALGCDDADSSQPDDNDTHTTAADTSTATDADTSATDTGADTRDTADAPEQDADAPEQDADAPDLDADAPDLDATDAADLEADTTPIGSAGCATASSALTEGENTFVLEGLQRRYILRLPVGYTTERAWPLVLALHGNGGSADYWDATSGERDIRGVLEHEAVLVIAEAIDGKWRDYDAPSDTWPARIEQELAYFDEVLTQARSELCIDEAAIFSMGFSGGGSFSGVLGCRRSDIRAIAVGGSVIYFDEADCVATPAAWITIGTEELTSGREAYRDFFRDRAGCEATSTPTSPDPCVAYDNCDADTPVHYCQHPGGHVWPDFGSQAMWDFFAQFVETAP